MVDSGFLVVPGMAGRVVVVVAELDEWTSNFREWYSEIGLLTRCLPI